MDDPSPQLEELVRLSYARLEPGRLFRGCKIAEDEKGMVVRIYSHAARYRNLMPTPYQIFRFDRISGVLRELDPDEAAPFVIQNYK